jgi:hypothetical protein
MVSPLLSFFSSGVLLRLAQLKCRDKSESYAFWECLRFILRYSILSIFLFLKLINIIGIKVAHTQEKKGLPMFSANGND